MVAHRFVAGALFAAAILSPTPGNAEGVAYRVRDLRTTLRWTAHIASDLHPFGARVFLNPDLPGLGAEPWLSDGTRAGSRLVANLAPGAEGSRPAALGVVGGALLFAAEEPAAGRELWRTDGTAAGTWRIADLYPGPRPSDPVAFGVLGGELVFAATDPACGRELWRSDGTAAGTRRIADLRPGAASGVLGDSAGGLNGRIYFDADDGVHGHELWRTDGNAAGTYLLKNIASGGEDAWVRSFFRVGGTLYFAASDSAHGSELWATDGSASGTHLVADLAPGSAAASPRPLGATGGRLIFVARPSSYVMRVFATDGTAAGTVPLAATASDGGAASFAGRVFFAGWDAGHGTEPWVTDGTPAGTIRLADVSPGSAQGVSGGFGRGHDGVYFCGYDGDGAASLWKSTGSSAATSRVVELPRCGSISASLPIASATLLDIGWWIDCGPGHFCEFHELWRSDGTTTGTKAFFIRPSRSSSYPEGITARTGGVVFRAYPDGATSSSLFYSDGSEAGTDAFAVAAGEWFRPDEFERAAPLADGELLLAGSGTGTGTELWRTDGDTVSLVRDILPGEDSSSPAHLIPFEGGALFGAISLPYSEELWLSDGTAPGTALVADLDPRPYWGSSPWGLTNVFGTVWFAASDAGGVRLAESRGTPATTRLHAVELPFDNQAQLRSLTPFDPATGSFAFWTLFEETLYLFDPSREELHELHVAAGQNQFSADSALARAGGRLFFLDVTDEGDCALWTSEGTAASTRRVKRVGSNPGIRDAYWDPCAEELVVFRDRLYFTSCGSAAGCELWTSDGTQDGTHRVADLEPGEFSFRPEGLTVIADRLYFSACRRATGCEPYVSDGTAAGTHRVADIAPGPRASDPSGFTRAGRLVYFAADDGTGEELWAMPVELFYDGFEGGGAGRWSRTRP